MAGDEEYVDVVQSQLDAVKDFAEEQRLFEGTHNEHVDRLGSRCVGRLHLPIAGRTRTI
jgi:hypothetical protein